MLWNTIKSRLKKNLTRVSGLLLATLLNISLPATAYAAEHVDFIEEFNVYMPVSNFPAKGYFPVTLDIKLPVPTTYTTRHIIYRRSGNKPVGYNGGVLTVTSNTGRYPSDDLHIVVNSCNLDVLKNSSWDDRHAGIDIRIGSAWNFYADNRDSNFTQYKINVKFYESMEVVKQPDCTGPGVVNYTMAGDRNEIVTTNFGEMIGHQYGAWKSDASKHWKECSPNRALPEGGVSTC